ncbi:MAG: hypothetical protein FWB88_03260 [Defluviitaleaceae bacterium]|nr:hypothetical protein [Defluviitaleaceae bacterium]MCL2238685.1 hypothetical protein [Defluviitaleaceae bacterium]
MKKLLLCIFAVALALVAFTACRGDDPTPVPPAPVPPPVVTPAPATPGTPVATPEPAAPVDYTISILTVSHSGELISTDHPAIRQLEELTGYRIELDMILNANFEEQMNLRLAARDLPGIVAITGNTLPIVQAARGGAFWDITDHIPQWPYLARANPAILRNISIDGRAFGMYRQRHFVRPGMVYRSDWLDYLGLPVPETLADLEYTLIAFTERNPQPNGGNTYGMAWTGGHLGPFHDLAVMHGAPNRWEVVNGNFVPWFEHPGFTEAMEFSRRLFDAGAINPDFIALPTGEWALEFGAGLTGWHMDVADEARRSANRLRDNEFMTQEELDAGEMVWVMGAVANAQGERRIRAAGGNAGYVAISTIGAPTDADLAHHLAFINMLNSPRGQTIVSRGAEGYNWEYVGGGRIRLLTADEIPPGMEVLEGLNQFMMRDADAMPLYGVNSREDRINEVWRINLDHAVEDPSIPLATLAPAWTANMGALNRLIDDAVSRYVAGIDDRAAFLAFVSQWYAEGGQDAINELNAAFAASQ